MKALKIKVIHRIAEDLASTLNESEILRYIEAQEKMIKNEVQMKRSPRRHRLYLEAGKLALDIVRA